jgi:hypothetical protein
MEFPKAVLEARFEKYDFSDFIVTDVGPWKQDENDPTRFTRLVYGEEDGVSRTVFYTVNIPAKSLSMAPQELDDWIEMK